MAEAQLIQTESMSHNRNQSRINKDEAELQELLKQAGVLSDESEDTEGESDSEDVVEPKVQTTGDSKQEEEPQVEAQEEDAGLTAEEKSFKKRYSDIRRHMQDKEAEHKAELEKLKSQLEAATRNELVLPKTAEDVEAWAKKYPDVAGIVEAIAEKKANERAADLEGRLKEIEAMRITAKRERAEVELAKLHPDFDSIRSDDAFHEWAAKQPKVYQDALYENAEDVQSVARVIDMYKADMGIKTKKPVSSDKDAAASVKTKRTTTPEADERAGWFSESQVNAMSDAEFEKNINAIQEAQKNKKFIYDVTRK